MSSVGPGMKSYRRGRAGLEDTLNPGREAEAGGFHLGKNQTHEMCPRAEKSQGSQAGRILTSVVEKTSDWTL